MRQILWLIPLLVPVLSNAQQMNALELLQTMNVDTVFTAFDPAEANEEEVYLAYAYGTDRLVDIPENLDLSADRVETIQLVYSNYPTGIEQSQRKLNLRRLQDLFDRLPAAREIEPEKWSLIMQSEVKNLAEARSLFHGFVISLKPPAEEPVSYKPNSDLPNFLNESDLYSIASGDSTFLKVIARNRDWQKMLVVTDLTGSMAPYTAQLLLWFKLNENKGLVEYFVFFNDGNEMMNEDKEIGKTGGIYAKDAKTFREVAQLAQETVSNGFGGDLPENNIEAILHGIENCPDCEDVVMIADNWATPRDMALLSKVTKPIRIVLCGTHNGVNPNYLNLALKTGGSVHTIEQDLTELVKLNEGEEIRIGKEIFVIKKGRFEFLKRM